MGGGEVLKTLAEFVRMHHRLPFIVPGSFFVVPIERVPD
jgi:hypothetical protein